MHRQQGDLSQPCIFIVDIDMRQGWLDEYVVFFFGHVYIKHHNFGVPVLTLSHILYITNIGGQRYTDM